MKHQFSAFPLRGITWLRQLPLILVLFSAACSKKGDAGPAGKDGNANVTVYNFGTRTFTSSLNFTVNVSQGKMDSSMLLVYYNPEAEAASAWYPAPGGGSGGLYNTRILTFQSAPEPSQYTVALRVVTPAGAVYATPLTFRKTRIFIVPANVVINGARQAPPVDLNDYRAVVKYYGIEE